MYLVLLKNNEQNKKVLDVDYFDLSPNLQIASEQKKGIVNTTPAFHPSTAPKRNQNSPNLIENETDIKYSYT